MLNDDQYKDIIIKKIAPTHILINDILSLRKQQLYPVLDEDILNDLDVLWDDLTYCTSSDDLIEWMLSFREYLWGNKNEWDEAKQWFSIDDEEYYINRIDTLVGETFFKMIIDDNFIEKFNMSEQLVIDSINKEESKISKRSRYHVNTKIELNNTVIEKYAKQISEKYHLKSINCNYYLSLNEIWSYLKSIDRAFKELVVLLKTENRKIGFHQLSLFFEDGQDTDRYFYSTKNKTIYLGLDFYGFIAEAWMNFIDNIIGEKYNITNENLNYLSHLSFSALGDTHDNILELKKEIRNKFSLNNSVSSSLFVMKNTLETLPLLLSHIQINQDSIKEFVDNRIFEVKTIIANIIDNDLSEKNYEEWKTWREHSELLWNEVKDNKQKQKIHRTWVYTIALVEKLSFSKELPKHKMWYIFSVFKDKVKNNQNKYWSSYEMLLSRSFSAYLNSRMLNNNCLSNDKTDPMLYPLKNELNSEIEFWDKWINIMLDIIEN